MKYKFNLGDIVYKVKYTGNHGVGAEVHSYKVTGILENSSYLLTGGVRAEEKDLGLSIVDAIKSRLELHGQYNANTVKESPLGRGKVSSYKDRLTAALIRNKNKLEKECKSLKERVAGLQEGIEYLESIE